jgi:hypothetical protein
MAMTQSDDRARNKGESASPNTKGNAPQHQGGDASRKTQQWGRGKPRKIGRTKIAAPRADVKS